MLFKHPVFYYVKSQFASQVNGEFFKKLNSETNSLLTIHLPEPYIQGSQ